MTFDDDTVPTDDALATSTRRALGRVATDGALSWDGVLAGARRVRRNRTFVGVVGSLMLVATGAGVAIASTGDGRTVQVVTRPTTTSSAATSVSTTITAPQATTTTTTTTTTPASSTSTTTAPQPPALVQPGDLGGVLTFASTTLKYGTATEMTLTIRNVADHAVRVPVDEPSKNEGVDTPKLGVWLRQGNASASSVLFVSFTDPKSLVLDPGESHTFRASVDPGSVQAGYTMWRLEPGNVAAVPSILHSTDLQRIFRATPIPGVVLVNSTVVAS